MNEKPDVKIYIDFSMAVVTPISSEAKDWVRKNVEVESWQYLGEGFAIEKRYLERLLEGFVENGFVVGKEG